MYIIVTKFNDEKKLLADKEQKISFLESQLGELEGSIHN